MTIDFADLNWFRGAAWFTLALCLTLSALLTRSCVRASWEYEQSIGCHWSLADKSSTIPAKAEHLDKFATALERQNLSGKHNAIIYPTADNSFDANLTALKTLQTRLHEIEGMPVESFQYQTAIQQITQQEQGEASAMLDVFSGTWLLERHFFLWDWVGFLSGVGCFVLLILAVVFFFKANDW